MTTFALVVGINAYPPRTGQPPLYGAVADASEFADWALDPAGGNVAPANLFFWTHPWPAVTTMRLGQFLAAPTPFEGDFGPIPPDQTRPPSARELVTTLLLAGQGLPAPAQGAAPHRAYVFLAGHGVRTFEMGSLVSQTCFLAGDFRNVNNQTAHGLVACESFRRALLAGGFGEIFMFLDCCRTQDSRLSIPAAVLCGAASEPANASWSVGNAAQDGEVALELTNPARGAFSLALLEGLRSHRHPADQSLPVGLLRNYVRDNIQTRSRGQNPSFPFNPDIEPGPLIIPANAAAPPLRAIVLDLSALPAGTMVQLSDGDLNPVGGAGLFAAAAAPVEAQGCVPGIYMVTILDGSGREQYFKHPHQGPVRVA